MTTTSIAQLSTILQDLFGPIADRLAEETGFVKRHRRLTGSSFARALVFGWLANPAGSLAHLARTGAAAGCAVTPQAWQQRWSEASAEFLLRLLETAVTTIIGGQRTSLPLLNQFATVAVVDSSTVSLPAVLAELWRGCGGGHSPSDGQAAVKVSVALDLVSGALLGLRLAAGRTHDRAAAPELDLPPGSLVLRDRGYFSLASLAAVASAGSYFLSRVQTGTSVRWDGRAMKLSQLARAQRLAPSEVAEVSVELGAAAWLPVRLMIWRVSPAECRRRRATLRKQAKHKAQSLSDESLALAGYHLLVTNAPAERLSAEQAAEVYRARWQVELLFKLWKSVGGLDESRSALPWRVLTEFYAKILAQVCAHWMVLAAGGWGEPRRSCQQATEAVRGLALAVLVGLTQRRWLGELMRVMAAMWAVGCEVNRRRGAPPTWWRLMVAGGEGLT